MAKSLDYDEAHRRARDVGPNSALVRAVRFILVPLLRLLFGLRVTGRENVPAEGAAAGC